MQPQDESQQTVSAVLVDHAQRPRNNYAMSTFSGRSRYTGSCGETIEMWVVVRDGVVEQATFISDGCAVSHACGSMATCMAEGRPLDEIEKMEPEHVINAFRGLPSDHAHCAELATTALKLACANVGEPGGGVEVEPDDLTGVVVRVALPVAAGRVVGLTESAERFALVDVEAATMRVLNQEDVAVPQRLSRPKSAQSGEPKDIESKVEPEDEGVAAAQTAGGAELLADLLQAQGVRVLLCGSMEEATRQILAERDVQVVVDAAPDIPEDSIAEYLAGSLHHGGNGHTM